MEVPSCNHPFCFQFPHSCAIVNRIKNLIVARTRHWHVSQFLRLLYFAKGTGSMFGTNDRRRAQMWRNETKAKQLLDRHGDEALGLARQEIRGAGLNLKVRWHWRRIERHLRDLQERRITRL